MFDSHMHTKNSPDSKQTIDEVCTSAIARGLNGIAITDHVDMWFYKKENTEERIRCCIKDVNAAREKYKDKLNIFQGVEMAEYMYSPVEADIIMTLTDYDVILGSVHSVFFEDWTDSYSRLPFDKESTSDRKIIGFLHEYFSKVTEMVENTDIDVMSHLTCPLRYINGKYGRGVDISLFYQEIEYILNVIIEQRIALEVNTSGINTSLKEFMPCYDIIKKYYSFGGRLITIGSDAHVPQNVGNGINEAKSALKEIGFKHYNYYEKRKPKEVPTDV